MLSQQELNALVSIINRTPMSPAEAVGMQVVINKLMPQEKKEEVKEKKKEEPNGP